MIPFYMEKGPRVRVKKALKQIDFTVASGMIKFLAGSCLSDLGIVLKESSVI
jgi:hypothetical protein